MVGVHVDVERAGPGRAAATVDGRRRRRASGGTVSAGQRPRRRRGRACPDAAAVVAARVRRAAAATTVTVDARRGGRSTTWRRPDRLPHGRRWTPRRTRRHAVHARRQRRPVFARGRQLDPRRLLPRPGHPRAATRDAARPGRRGRTSTCCASGAAASTRATTSTTLCDELGAPGLAGLPVRLRRLRRGGAAARRGRRRGARERHPAERRTPASCCGTAATRTSGATTTGAGRRQLGGPHLGLAATTPSCCPASSPSSTRPGRTAPGSPYSARPATSTRTTPAHGTTHVWDVWNRLDYTALPRLRAPVRRRVRLPGPADLGDADPRPCTTSRCAPDSPGIAAAPEGRRTATASWPRGLAPPPAGARRLRRLALGDPAQPGAGGRVRRRALPLADARTAWARSSGSSTTAGRSLVGRGRRRRTPQAALVRAARSFAPRLLTVQPRDGGLALVAVNDTDQPWTGARARQRRSPSGIGAEEATARPRRPCRAVTARPCSAAPRGRAGRATRRWLLAASRGTPCLVGLRRRRGRRPPARRPRRPVPSPSGGAGRRDGPVLPGARPRRARRSRRADAVVDDMLGHPAARRKRGRRHQHGRGC